MFMTRKVIDKRNNMTGNKRYNGSPTWPLPYLLLFFHFEFHLSNKEMRLGWYCLICLCSTWCKLPAKPLSHRTSVRKIFRHLIFDEEVNEVRGQERSCFVFLFIKSFENWNRKVTSQNLVETKRSREAVPMWPSYI